MTTRVPETVDDFTGFLLYRLGTEAARIIERTLAPLGLGAREVRLLGLIPAEGLSQRSLGELAGLDRTTMVGVVDRMESAELVERHRSTTDRRRYVITVTEHGRTIRDRALTALATAEHDYLSPLSAEQRTRLRGDLRTLYAARVIDC